ncbi:SAM-dependent methyltransferase [Amycolatopsis sp. NPDC059021]|uniref:SAM-dependent methyltransferase n=1 Tax=Amycolatopsis sp. NPDC059021 TaxID=3346704 RepID=UPI00366CBE9A
MPDEPSQPDTPDDRLVDIERPSVSRVCDWLLGGSYNTPIDRDFAEQILRIFPAAKTIARDSRNFLRRVVAHLIDRGVHQFIDVGSGIPTVGNTHDVARALHPDARVVYVDNDPVAVAQSNLLLRHDPHAIVIDADLRRPADIIDNPAVRAALDFTRPIALLMIAILHFIPDADDPAAIISAYRTVLPPGSYLAISHLTDETATPVVREQVRGATTKYQATTRQLIPRTRATLDIWLRGTELLPPGITTAHSWNPDDNLPTNTEHELLLGAVTRTHF